MQYVLIIDDNKNCSKGPFSLLRFVNVMCKLANKHRKACLVIIDSHYQKAVFLEQMPCVSSQAFRKWRSSDGPK